MRYKCFNSGYGHLKKALSIVLIVAGLIFGLVLLPGGMVAGEKEDSASDKKDSLLPYIVDWDLIRELRLDHDDFFERHPQALDSVHLSDIILDGEDGDQATLEVLNVIINQFMSRIDRSKSDESFTMEGYTEAVRHENILSVIYSLRYHDKLGQDSTMWSQAYNFKLPEGKRLSDKELLKELGWEYLHPDDVIEDSIFTKFLGDANYQGKIRKTFQNKSYAFCASFPNFWENTTKALYLGPAGQLKVLCQTRTMEERKAMEDARKEWKSNNTPDLDVVAYLLYPDIELDYLTCDAVILPRRQITKINEGYRRFAKTFTDVDPEQSSAPVCFIAYLGSLNHKTDEEIKEFATKVASIYSVMNYANPPLATYHLAYPEDYSDPTLVGRDVYLVIPKDPKAKVFISNKDPQIHRKLEDRSANIGDGMLLVLGKSASSSALDLGIRTRNMLVEVPISVDSQGKILDLPKGFVDVGDPIRQIKRRPRLETNNLFYVTIEGIAQFLPD